MVPISEVPVLEHLMSCYYHPDHDLQGGVWGALEAFVGDEPQMAAVLVQEIRTVLATAPGEAEIEAFLAELGNFYYPPAAGMTFRAWLEEIAHRVRTVDH